MKNIKYYLILLVTGYFFSCDNLSQKESDIGNYKGYALFQTYLVNDGRFNFNIFPIDIENVKSLDERKFVIQYGLIVSSESFDEDYAIIREKLKNLNYNYNDEYILVQIDYELKDKNWNQSVKKWNDSIRLKNTYYKIKVYFPQNDGVIKINNLNIIKKIKQ